MATFSLVLTIENGAIKTNFNYMEIYQGEPLTGRMYHKKEDGTYATQQEMQAYSLEIIIKDNKGITQQSWKYIPGGSDNTITIGNDTEVSTARGYAAFKIKGSETRNLQPGIYTFEFSKIENTTDGDRAIGLLTDILTIKQCNIKGGVS